MLVGYRFGWFDYRHTLEHVARLRRMHGFALFATSYILIFAIGSAFGLPGLPFIVAAGALFGTLLGSVLAWVGAMLGSVLGYLIARTVGHDIVVRWLRRFRRVDAAIAEARDFGGMLRLRLVPVLPLGTVNFVGGLARAPVVAYLAATAVGIIPSTVIYAYFADSLLEGARSGRVNAVWSLAVASSCVRPLVGAKISAVEVAQTSSRRGNARHSFSSYPSPQPREAPMRSSAVAVALFVVSAAPAVLTSQGPKQSGAPRSEVKTWTTPYDKSARPRDPFADQQGRVWFVGQEGNFVSYLDPETGKFKQYTIEPGMNRHNLVVDKHGMVWFTGNRNGRIVQLDPATGKPIPIGAVTTMSGIGSFKEADDAVRAYFDCVNANGGIHGRPITYHDEDDQSQLDVAAQAAKKPSATKASTR